MTTYTKIKGFDKVLTNLNAEITKILWFSQKGLIKGAILIRRDMDKTPPLIPIDTNNLRASWHATPAMVKVGPVIFMGFTANYAAAVHEKIGGHFKRPNSGPKFFEYAIKRNKEKILTTIRDNIKL